MGRLIKRTLAGYFIAVGVLPLILMLYHLPDNLEGLTPAIKRSNILGAVFSIPFFLIPVLLGVSIWKSKGLLKAIGWLFVVAGAWLVLSGLGPAGPLNYMKFASVQLLPIFLTALGGLHLATGYAMLKKKSWSRISGIVILLLWSYSIVSFFSGFMYTRHSLTAIVTNSLTFVIPIALCTIYLLTPEAREEFK